MKKLLFFLASAIALTMMVSCEDNFQEPNPTPPTPVEHKTVLNFNLDWPLEEVTVLAVMKINHREGTSSEYWDATTLTEIYDDFSQNVSIVIPDSLRGKTCEMWFFIDYSHEDRGYSAQLVKEVTFSSQEDTTYLGNVGFSNYNWYTHPPLVLVIEPDNTKYYSPY